jgi:hypothetical protein
MHLTQVGSDVSPGTLYIGCSPCLGQIVHRLFGVSFFRLFLFFFPTYPYRDSNPDPRSLSPVPLPIGLYGQAHPMVATPLGVG